MPVTAQSAHELLGEGFAPRQRLFTPVDLGGGLSASDRYRHLTGVIAEENAVQKVLTDTTLSQNSYLNAERENQAIRQENDVLAELNKLDPLDDRFADYAGQFSQMASVSPAVSRVLDLKMQQRTAFNQSLGTLADASVAAGVSQDEFEHYQSTATELLRRGDLAGYRDMLSRVQRQATMVSEENAINGLRQELQLRDKFAKRKERRSNKEFDRRDAAARNTHMEEQLLEAQFEEAQKFNEASIEHRRKQAEVLRKVPSRLTSDTTEMVPGGDYSFADWFADPFGSPARFNFDPDRYTLEDVTAMTPEQRGELGITDDMVAGLQNGQLSDVTIPNELRAEEVIARKVVQEQVREYVVGSNASPRMEGFAGLEEMMNSGEAEEFLNDIAAGALSMNKEAFIAAFTTSKVDESKTHEGGEESPVAQAPPLLQEVIGLSSTTRAQKFLSGLYDTVRDINDIALAKEQFRLAHPRFEEMAQMTDLIRQETEFGRKTKEAGDAASDDDLARRFSQ